MPVSVRMDPLLERELDLAAQRQGVTKSQFIIRAVERAIGRKNPYELLVALKAEEARGARGKPDPFAGVAQPYGADASRALIVTRLRKKLGVSGPR